MDGDYLHNPLAYDEQVVAEKLGIYDYSPKPENDVNVNLELALMREELTNSKRQLARLQRRSTPVDKRETFVSGGCGCGSSEGFSCNKSIKSDIGEMSFDNKKLLTFLVIILAAFCIIQYISYRNENRELLDMMCTLMKQVPMGSSSVVQSQLQPQSQPQPQPTA